jgi:hypothetical protein
VSHTDTPVVVSTDEAPPDPLASANQFSDAKERPGERLSTTTTQSQGTPTKSTRYSTPSSVTTGGSRDPTEERNRPRTPPAPTMVHRYAYLEHVSSF